MPGVTQSTAHILFPVLVTILMHWDFFIFLDAYGKGGTEKLCYPVYTDVGLQGWSAQIQSPGFPLRTRGSGQNSITKLPGILPSHLIWEGRPHGLGIHVFTRQYFKGVRCYLYSSPMKVMFAAVFERQNKIACYSFNSCFCSIHT